MSSTDRDTLLSAFFRDHLLPAAAALHERGAELIEPGPDPSAASYWHVRTDSGSALVGVDFAGLEATLRELWEAEGLPELAALAEPLVDLAHEIQEERDEQPEVDPYIYQMF